MRNGKDESIPRSLPTTLPYSLTISLLGPSWVRLYEHNLIKYRRGTLNRIADALYRNLIPISKVIQAHLKIITRLKETRWNIATFLSKKTVSTISLLENMIIKNLNCPIYETLRVPKPQRDRVMKENRDAPNSGHTRIAKTITWVARQYHWPGIVRDIIMSVVALPVNDINHLSNRYRRKCNHRRIINRGRLLAPIW